MRYSRRYDVSDTTSVLQDIFVKMSPCNKRPRGRRAERPLCDQPEIGSLIKELGYEFLVATLDLKADHFIKECPTSKLTDHDRQTLKGLIEDHSRVCPSCQAEVRAQKQWDQDFQKFLAAQTRGPLKNTAGSIKSKRRRPNAVSAARASRANVLHR